MKDRHRATPQEQEQEQEQDSLIPLALLLETVPPVIVLLVQAEQLVKAAIVRPCSLNSISRGLTCAAINSLLSANFTSDSCLSTTSVCSSRKSIISVSLCLVSRPTHAKYCAIPLLSDAFILTLTLSLTLTLADASPASKQ